MNGMLDGVVDRYLQGASEQEFDMPLMALLVSRRFYDIHKLHGVFEFGKDFIAKREVDGVVHQYAIQSKAGDINLGSWRQVRPQIDEARYNGIAHPSYDRSLQRKAILVTTGRLVGGAAGDAQEYKTFWIAGTRSASRFGPGQAKRLAHSRSRLWYGWRDGSRHACRHSGSRERTDQPSATGTLHQKVDGNSATPCRYRSCGHSEQTKILQTDRFGRDYCTMRASGCSFLRIPIWTSNCFRPRLDNSTHLMRLVSCAHINMPWPSRSHYSIGLAPPILTSHIQLSATAWQRPGACWQWRTT